MTTQPSMQIQSAAEMCGILKVAILGSPRTLGGDRSSPGTTRDSPSGATDKASGVSLHPVAESGLESGFG